MDMKTKDALVDWAWAILGAVTHPNLTGAAVMCTFFYKGLTPDSGVEEPGMRPAFLISATILFAAFMLKPDTKKKEK